MHNATTDILISNQFDDNSYGMTNSFNAKGLSYQSFKSDILGTEACIWGQNWRDQ